MTQYYEYMLSELKKAYDSAKKLNDQTEKKIIENLVGEVYWAENDDNKILTIYHQKFIPFTENHWYFFE